MGIDAEILLDVDRDFTDEDIQQWSWDLCATFGAGNFFIDVDQGQGAIERDGHKLRVNVWTRYYGIGYERGDLLLLCGVAEWCERNIPGCTVWYGGDSGETELWPDAARRALRAHMYGVHGWDYFDRALDDGLKPPQPCKLCIGKGEFSQYGFGGDYAAIACAGCGRKWQKRGNAAWEVVK